MNFIKTFALIFILIAIFSCGTKEREFQTHESGLRYRFIQHDKEATAAQPGDILVLKLIYKTEDDSVLFDSKEIGKMYRMQFGKQTHSGGCIEDAFSLLHIGDSLECKINAAMFFNHTRNMEVPHGIDGSKDLIFEMKLTGIQSVKQIQDERKAIRHNSAQREEELLQHYLKISNIVTEPLMSGLYYIPQKEGQGKKAEAGKKVTVEYVGSFIDGSVFDNSYESDKPFTFILGAAQVIPGMEEGISKMREGGKATLIIPSHLAYKDQQTGPIPPYSTLIFEVELLKVE